MTTQDNSSTLVLMSYHKYDGLTDPDVIYELPEGALQEEQVDLPPSRNPTK